MFLFLIISVFASITPTFNLHFILQVNFFKSYFHIVLLKQKQVPSHLAEMSLTHNVYIYIILLHNFVPLLQTCDLTCPHKQSLTRHHLQPCECVSARVWTKSTMFRKEKQNGCCVFMVSEV